MRPSRPPPPRGAVHTINPIDNLWHDVRVTTTPTPRRPRLIAPDLARGIMLLSIGLANVVTAWAKPHPDDPMGSVGGIHEGSVFDQVTMVLGAMFVHVRGLPMFSTMLGFGIGLISLSLLRRQYPRGAAIRVLARRYLLLALFGGIHMVFLFWGDIMMVYGLCGAVIALMIGLSNKALRIIAWVALGLQIASCTAMALAQLFLPDGALGLGSESIDLTDEMVGAQSSYPQMVSGNLLSFGLQLFLSPTQFFLIGPVMLLGLVWAREGIVAHPERHRRLLMTWVGIGVAVIVLVGLPLGLSAIDVLPAAWHGPLTLVNSAVGWLVGPAGLAFVTLLAPSLRADGPVTWALCALGKRSMSGYVGQSVLFLVIFAPFALNLGNGSGATVPSLIAVAVWAITLAAACVLEKRGSRGPLEAAHRRLAYGKKGLHTIHPAAEPGVAAGPLDHEREPHHNNEANH